jgi:hypothetical protein
MVKTASTAIEKVACRWSSRAGALIKSGYLGRRVTAEGASLGPQ